MQTQNPSPPVSQDVNSVGTEQKTEPNLPSEEPKGKKKNFVLVAVVVLLLLAVPSLITYYLISSGQDEGFVEKDEEVVLEDAEQDIESLVAELQNFVRNYIHEHGVQDYDFYEESYVKRGEEEGEYYGMRWVNDQGDTELIRGGSEFTLDLSTHDDKERELYIKDCFNQAKDFLEEEGFAVNFEKESDFGEVWMLGLEKNERKCLIYRRGNYSQMSVECGDFNNVDTPVEFKEIYRDLDPMEHDSYFHVEKVSGDFAYVNKSSYDFGPSQWYFLKKDNGNWEEESSVQGETSCGVLFEMGMEPQVFEEFDAPLFLYECGGKETYREYYNSKMN